MLKSTYFSNFGRSESKIQLVPRWNKLWKNYKKEEITYGFR
jgi:hypothetical protein